MVAAGLRHAATTFMPVATEMSTAEIKTVIGVNGTTAIGTMSNDRKNLVRVATVFSTIVREIKNGSLGIDRKATVREENAPDRSQIEVKWILRHTEASSAIGPTAWKELSAQAISEPTTATAVAGAAVRGVFEEVAVFVVEEDSGEVVAGAEEREPAYGSTSTRKTILTTASISHTAERDTPFRLA